MKIVICFFLLFYSITAGARSLTGTAGARSLTGTTYALVVGISNYQDPEIPDLKYAQRDAEAFAAYLQSPSGGSVPRENINLLTSSQATYAKFSLALDWLFEKSIIADRVILYLAGYGDTETDENGEPGYFLLADSPLTPLQAGAFEIRDIASVFESIFRKRDPNFLFVANLCPFIMPPGIGYEPVKMKETKKNIFSHTLACRFITEADLLKAPEEIAQSKFTLNQVLLDGFLGFADKNEDEEVSYWEMRKFFKKAPPVEQRWPGLLFIATGLKHEPLARVDAATFKKLQRHTDGLFPSIIHLETTEREDEILGNAPEQVTLMYQDFILTIKLAQLLEPKDRCASFFYEQLKDEPSLEKLHGDMRRKLAAALLDEVQQALNAYLKLDHSELERRDSTFKPYQRYTDYMARALDLFGSRNFMKNTMQAKYYYFSGLVSRMEAVQNNRDSALLENAIAAQQKALEYEPAASYVYNELGVVCDLKEDHEQARMQFEMALEYSPNWGIPHSNLCIIYTKQENYIRAIEHGKTAFRLSPRNVFVTGTLANAYYLAGDLNAAGKLLEIVVKKDPKNEDALSSLSAVYLQSGNLKKATETLQTLLQSNPNNGWALYNMACLKSLDGDKAAALSLLEKALQSGFNLMSGQEILNDPDLGSIINDALFTALLRKYFPEGFKE